MRDSKPMVDTNILVYAHNQDSPYFAQAKTLLTDLINEGGFSVSNLILFEFFSVITNGRKVEAPLHSETALYIITDMIESQNIAILQADDDHHFFQWIRQYINTTKRYQIYDASIAYVMFQNEITDLHTNNIKDFKKFDFIKIINPFHEIRIPQSKIRNGLIPYGHQSIDEEDVAAVCSALRSDWLTTGPKVEEFEKAIADYVGAKYAIAVSSGTAALHAAMYALGIGPGDEVILPPMTFAATANCVVFQGGTPVFTDVDPNTLLIDPIKVEAAITQKTKAIIAVDYAGQPCDYDRLREIAEKHKLVLVGDSCHALGAEYKGKKVGSVADMTIFSFHPVKHITTGEGGMITTDDEELASRMRLFRNHGITRNPSNFFNLQSSIFNLQSPPPFYYEMIDLGYNYRITDIQCALGLSQFTKLPEFLQRRREIAALYDEALSEIAGIESLGLRSDVLPAPRSMPAPLNSRKVTAQRIQPGLSACPTCPVGPVDRTGVEFTEGDSVAHSTGAPCSLHAYHLYVIRLKGVDREKVFKSLRERDIGVNVHYIPVHLHPFYRNHFEIGPGHCPIAESAYGSIISIPIFPGMSDEDAEQVITCFKEVTNKSN